MVSYPGPDPLSLASLSSNPETIKGGQSATGQVVLSGNAPSGGVTINLSSNQGAVSVPGQVFVPGGTNSAGFAITTQTAPARLDVIISAQRTDPNTGYSSSTAGWVILTP
ncbi:MAG TPA: hypothetical protein VFJ58_20275 [Armatimonadota bacterium]|nr:hypothetical protein [Armatimonadota bacterium]